MTQRIVGGQTYTLNYDAESYLTEIISGTVTASFTYDGDGQRVKASESGSTTVYIGGYFEWQVNTGQMTKYYYAGAMRVAKRTGDGAPQFLLGDHLGSASKVVNYNGTVPGEQRYKAWGEVRFGDVPTDYQYTGQFRQKLQGQTKLGLYYYNARWYDPSLGRFIQADTIVPETFNTQSWDRYAYVLNNSLNYTDPSGNYWCDSEFDGDCKGGRGNAWDTFDDPDKPPQVGGNPNLVCDNTGLPDDVTCEEVVQFYIDMLWKYGGVDGRLKVAQFMERLDQGQVTVNFTHSGGGMQTNASTGTISINRAYVTNYLHFRDGIDTIDVEAQQALYRQALMDASDFGHELFHLIDQADTKIGGYFYEKAAYDFQQKLLNSMNLIGKSEGVLESTDWLDVSGWEQRWWQNRWNSVVRRWDEFWGRIADMYP